MQVKDPAAGRDRLCSRGGFALMVIGVIVAIAGLRPVARHHEPARPARRDRHRPHRRRGRRSSAPRCSCAARSSTFLRFWLARLIYEQKAQTDRIVDRG